MYTLLYVCGTLIKKKTRLYCWKLCNGSITVYRIKSKFSMKAYRARGNLAPPEVLVSTSGAPHLQNRLQAHGSSWNSLYVPFCCSAVPSATFASAVPSAASLGWIRNIFLVSLSIFHASYNLWQLSLCILVTFYISASPTEFKAPQRQESCINQLCILSSRHGAYHTESAW